MPWIRASRPGGLCVERNGRGDDGRERFGTILVSLFGALALILTAVGVYSVAAQTVRNRLGKSGSGWP